MRIPTERRDKTYNLIEMGLSFHVSDMMLSIGGKVLMILLTLILLLFGQDSFFPATNQNTSSVLVSTSSSSTK